MDKHQIFAAEFLRMPSMTKEKTVMSQREVSKYTLLPERDYPMPRSQTSLVFLKEGHSSKHRLMQKAGGPHMHTSSKSPEWFEDHRYQPNQQAQYLKKLSRLREDLTNQDIYRQKKTAPEPSLRNGPQRDRPSVNKQGREGSRNGYNALMDRQRKLQTERMKYFEKHRGPTTDAAERVASIEIRPLTDISPLVLPSDREDIQERPYESARASDAKFVSNSFANERVPKMTKVSLPYLTSPSQNFVSTTQATNADIMHHDVINDIIEGERKRARDKKELEMFPSQYTSSIPNIGRRALMHPGNLLNHPFNTVRSRQDSCVKQVSMHKKDRRGIYKGKKNSKKVRILRADADEMDLSPEFLSFYSSKYLEDDDETLQVPCTTPNPHGLEMERGQYRQYTKEDLTELRRQFHRHRTHTETSMDLEHSRKQEDHHDHSAASKTCVFCQHPELLPFAIPASEYMVLPGDRPFPENNRNIESLSSRVPQLKFAEEKPGNKKKLSMREKRKNIVVDVPQMESVPSFVVNSPSPHVTGHHSADLMDSKSSSSKIEDHRNGVLYKTFKQNELRKREITNLLEDVRELNQLTKHFDNESEDEEVV